MMQTMFLVEHAYWYYEDNLRERYPSFRHFTGFEPFARWYFGRSKILAEHAVRGLERKQNLSMDI